jgi:Rieske Fe-S protein
MTDTTRRVVLAGAAGVSAAAVLAACGDTPTKPAGQDANASPASTTSAAQSASGGENAGSGSLGKTSEIPVGGGKVFKAEKIVVTQPTAGEFKAFTSVCTHQGCDVKSVSGGRIKCPCHGSEYSDTDGTVKVGPASRPLASKAITVSGGDIKLA